MVKENETKETEEPKAEVKQEEKPKSILDETKKAIEEIKKERQELSKIKDELQQLKSDQLLSSTAGGRVEPAEPKEETPQEYKNRVMQGKL